MDNYTLICIILYTTGIIFALCGLGLIAAGTIVSVTVVTYITFLYQDFRIAPILTIIIGSISLGSAIVGIIGVHFSQDKLIGAYVVCVGILFLLEISVAIYVTTCKEYIAEKVERNMDDSFTIYFQAGRRGTELEEEDIKHNIWNVIQYNFRCCGDRDGDPYDGWPSIPPSCCGKVEGECDTNDESYSPRGCLVMLVSALKIQHTWLIGLSLAAAALQILTILCGLILFAVIRSVQNEGLYP